ncbi:MAG: DIP1984 family protein [Bifidobacteriaceae bacterium]|nr:DIP1984 family protein [Bifidobacteriaceae bacterium]
MKLAEALQERADLNEKIGDLSVRLGRTALAQEGEKPVEDPQTLLAALNAAVDRMAVLITTINLTNDRTVVNGRTITQIIAQKDCEGTRLAAYRQLIRFASASTDRARGAEIRIRPTVDVAALQKEADRIAKRIRLLDNTLQSTNWSTELIEDIDSTGGSVAG